MQGFHSAPMIVDAYCKGIRNYDAEKAYHAVKSTAMKDTFGLDMRRFVGLLNYKKYNFVPANLEYESVAKTLEYAYDDWTVAQFAKMLGHQKDYEYFIKRAENYKNVFDKSTNFMRGRMEDGSWRTPFDPFFSHHRLDDFMEGNAWQWTFFVPHDPVGLAKLLGGKEVMTNKLDSLFMVKPQKKYDFASGDMSGMMGQYAHGNEVSQHIPYLYNYLGQPWKTQERVRMIMTSQYDITPEGYCGNEDTGQMSAWYIFSAMGFYPINHGQGQYIIGTPLFDRVEFDHGFGRKLIVVARNNNDKNFYIQSVKLNGKAYTKKWFQHGDLFNKGNVTVEF
jgi:predicted alpha-1,2-mannosidase